MASAPQKSSGPTVALSKVPSVRKLSDQLGIQHASLKESTVFMDTIHAFRKSCTTNDGSLVSTLVDWNLPSVQEELRIAAVKFLDDHGNGKRFWAPTRSWAQPTDPHYPENEDRIIDLLVQLFWKQNRYLNNNSRYNGKQTDSHSRGDSADQWTPARESHEQKITSSSTASLQSQKWKNENKPTASARLTEVATASPIITEGAEHRSVAVTHIPHQVDDICDLTQDSDGKHPRSERPESENAARKRKRQQIGQSPRRTERKRNPRSMPWSAPAEEVAMILDNLEDVEAEDDTPSPLTAVARKRKSDSANSLQIGTNISGSGGDAHTVSNQSELSNGPFAAPTAPMVSTERHIAPQLSLSTEQSVSSIEGVHLKMPHPDRPVQSCERLSPNPSANVHPETSHTNNQNAELVGKTSSGLQRGIEASSTEWQPTSTPSPAQDPSKAALRSVEEKPGPSLSRASSSMSDADSGLLVKDLIASLQSTTPSHAGAELPSAKLKHLTPEPVVLQALKQSSTPVARPRVQIPFWIITREPLYTEELWNEGKFHSLLFADFVDGITKVTQRDNIEKVKLTLRTPFSNTILTVHGEDVWSTAKAAFTEKLKGSRAEARAKKLDDSGGYKILVEPFYKQVVTRSDGAEAYDDMFDYDLMI